jgi:hypothetical protein
MNLAITSARTWKAIKTHYLVAIAAVALVLTTMAGAGAMTIDLTNPTNQATTLLSDSDPPATYQGPSTATPSELATTYFLVGSESQRTAVFLQVEEGEWSLPRNQASEPNFFVLLAGTPEDGASALSFLNAEEARLGAAYAGMDVIDLRVK